MCLLRRDIGQHRDHALCAQRQKRHNLIVIAGIDIHFSLCERHKLCILDKVIRRVLHAHDICLLLAQGYNRLWQQIHAAGSARNIVENHRNLNRLRNQFKMLF